MMGILSNEWVAWQFDRAVRIYGAYVEDELADIDKETGKPKRSLKDIIDRGARKRTGTARDLIAIGAGRVK